MLYLASSSKSRQRLLNQAKIDFEVLRQNSKEALSSKDVSFENILLNIAIDKMESIIWPSVSLEEAEFLQGCEVLVLTADTLGLNYKGDICTKPLSKENAIQMIVSYRKSAITGTAFCLDRRRFIDTNWQLINRITGFAQAEYIFDVPDDKIEWYLEKGFEDTSYMNVSGAVMIEGVGSQFLKSIKGSYTAVLGLPMYEVVTAISNI